MSKDLKERPARLSQESPLEILAREIYCRMVCQEGSGLTPEWLAERALRAAEAFHQTMKKNQKPKDEES
jgi:hypothetical protein